MTDSLATINLRRTSQDAAADPRQVLNSAGGYTFTLDDTARLRRFLILGTEGGTYYTGARELTKENADVVIRMARENSAELLNAIVDVSLSGSAPRQNPTLFALAAAVSLGDDQARKAALAVVSTVARTGTHLFLFMRYVEQFRGWGRGLRRAVGSWYTDKTVDDLAYQMLKYRQREGYTHRDALRLSHPATIEVDRKALFDWTCGREVGPDTLPRMVQGFLEAQKPGANVPAFVREYGLSWEMLPDNAVAQPATWEALLERGLPQTALMRQLPRLTKLGLLPQMGGHTAAVVAQLTDAERLTKARVHPINVLVAARTYASGESARGSGTWTPTARIIDALDAAFYAAFAAVEPTGKRTRLALDVSGSMVAQISNMPLSCREASAALALVTASVEPEHDIVGFTAKNGNSWGWGGPAALTPLSISPRQRLDDAISTVSGLPFGGTDCALPMTDALATGTEIDTFVVFTDSETWAGKIHPHQALQQYRRETGIPARLVVVGMTSTGFTIADPGDFGMLDIAGMDSAVPSLINEFSRGAV